MKEQKKTIVKQCKDLVFHNVSNYDKKVVLGHIPTKEDRDFYDVDKPIKIKGREEAGSQDEAIVYPNRDKSKDIYSYIPINLDDFLDEVDKAKKLGERQQAIIDEFFQKDEFSQKTASEEERL